GPTRGRHERDSVEGSEGGLRVLCPESPGLAQCRFLPACRGQRVPSNAHALNESLRLAGDTSRIEDPREPAHCPYLQATVAHPSWRSKPKRPRAYPVAARRLLRLPGSVAREVLCLALRGAEAIGEGSANSTRSAQLRASGI